MPPTNSASLAQIYADYVLLSSHLTPPYDTANTALQASAIIRKNPAWAVAYNTVAIPATAFGLLNPRLSGIGMSLSSAVVVINALRLRRLPRNGQRSPVPTPHGTPSG